MKHLLILALVLLLAVGPVGAVKETFQDWDSSTFTFVTTGTGLVSMQISATTGDIYMWLRGSQFGNTASMINSDASTFTYAAFDYSHAATFSADVNTVMYLQDASHVTLSSISVPYKSSESRLEVKIIGGAPTVYIDGTLYNTYGIISTNPSYLYITHTSTTNQRTASLYVDNFLISESDHHVIGSIPSNWSIIRDFTNPASTGVYAWNPSTSAWVLKNSNDFYIDADTDSTDSTYTENVIITNVQYGTIVNTTAIDSTVPRHQLTYNINAFLNTPTALGTSIPDGEYSVCFEGSTACESLWVISNGASISLDKTSYIIGDSAIVSYTMLPAYFDTTTYTYTLKLLNVYGEEIESKAINSATGVDAFTFDTSGVQFIEVVATGKADSKVYILGVAATTVYEYLAFNIHVYDGNTTAALSGVAYNFTQGSTIVTGSSGFDGNGSASGFGTGSVLTYNFTKTGYYAWNFSLTPITTGTKVLDVTMAPKPDVYTGVGLGGVIHDSVYGSTIPDATVTATNGTTGTVAANSRGYYIFDNNRGGPLVSGRCYQMNAVKTGYTFALPTACVGV